MPEDMHIDWNKPCPHGLRPMCRDCILAQCPHGNIHDGGPCTACFFDRRIEASAAERKQVAHV